MKNLIQQITNFVPFNEQEDVDKQVTLELLNTFNDVLTRKNNFGHFSSSALVLNTQKNKVLLVNHNIFGGYIYPGGHADGDADLLGVAKREVEEETGVNATELSNDIYGLQILPVEGHVKRGKYVACHPHYDFIYLFVAPESEVKIKEDENSQVKWVLIEDIKNNKIKLVDFVVPIFQKLFAKLESEHII